MAEVTEAQAGKETWERGVLEKLARAALEEQKRARHWSIFFRLLVMVYLFIILFMALGWVGDKDRVSAGPHTAMVELEGVIAEDEPASAERVIMGLQDAFKDKNTRGVILKINSPGGSPVQSGYINDEIKRLREKYPDTPIYAVVEDICASGGYYAAVATDKIFVDKASVVGSIGVLIDSFGFTETMEKLGVDRRLITAGENKGFLDPFSPLDPEHREHAKKMLFEVHKQFIAVVRAGRGERLKDNPELFTGLIWSGAKSIELGLADAMGSADYVAREIIKAEEIVDFTPEENFAERLAKRFGAGMANALIAAFATPRLR
ncbi:MAG: S49 family peptidase [Burkholderiales bacterium]